MIYLKHKWTDIILWIIGTELVGAFSSLIAGGNFSAFYKALEKPPFSPPGWLFPVAWGILYALMGISAYLVHKKNNLKSKKALCLYYAQLIANFLWTPVFFGLRSFPGASIIVLVMLAIITAMILAFYKIDKKAAYLNIPYLLWTVYAAYLTIGVCILQ